MALTESRSLSTTRRIERLLEGLPLAQAMLVQYLTAQPARCCHSGAYVAILWIPMGILSIRMLCLRLPFQFGTSDASACNRLFGRARGMYDRAASHHIGYLPAGPR